jgi:hypothetical protein
MLVGLLCYVDISRMGELQPVLASSLFSLSHVGHGDQRIAKAVDEVKDARQGRLVRYLAADGGNRRPVTLGGVLDAQVSQLIGPTGIQQTL